VPDSLYEHHLIERVRFTLRHDRTDQACPGSGDGCDGWPVKLQLYDQLQEEYWTFFNLQDTGDGDIKTQSGHTEQAYDDEANVYVWPHSYGYEFWVRIDAPDGAGGPMMTTTATRTSSIWSFPWT